MKSFDELKTDYLESDVRKSRSEQIEYICEQGGLEDLLFPILWETDFFWAPASTKYHLHELGGLSQHVIDVFTHLLTKTNDVGCAAKLAICHDLCKVNLYQGKVLSGWKPYTDEEREAHKAEHGKYPKNKGYTRDYLSWSTRKETKCLGHGALSVIRALQWGVELTDAEMAAIMWHMADDGDRYYSYRALRNTIEDQHYSMVKALQRADQDATHEEGD